MSEDQAATASAVHRAEALFESLGARVKQAGAKIQAGEAKIRNGASTPSEPSPNVASARDATERAEETLDRTGERIGVLAAALSHRVRKSLALAREEAEDIWAEAQALRQNTTL